MRISCAKACPGCIYIRQKLKEGRAVNMYTSIDLSALREKKGLPRGPAGSFRLPDRWTIFMGVVYLAGILIGTKAMSLAPEELRNGMLTIFSEQLTARSAQTLQQTVFSGLLQSAVPLVLLFLMGFCALAAPFIPAVLLFEGMGYGVSVAAMLEYTAQQNVSVWLGLLLLVPFALGCALIWISFSADALKISLQCWRILCAGNTEEPLILGQYSRRFFWSLGMAVLLSAANGVWVQLLASRIG